MVNTNPPTKTVTLPDKGRVSLAEYRTRMREQLMKTENATASVADCAAHASWVVPRSATYDALKIPTGALSNGRGHGGAVERPVLARQAGGAGEFGRDVRGLGPQACRRGAVATRAGALWL